MKPPHSDLSIDTIQICTDRQSYAHFFICSVLYLAIFVLSLTCSPAYAENPMKQFESLVEKDEGLSPDEKKEWISIVRENFKEKQFSFDYSRLVYGILSQATFDEVDLKKAGKVALHSTMAVENGAPEDEVSELTVFAFSSDLTAEEIRLYADISKKCYDSGVAVHVTQEMLGKAKEENWSANMVTILMQGLMEAGQHGSDTEKMALFMMISVAQKLGTPEQIVKDAIENAKKREPDKWKEGPEETTMAAVEHSAMTRPKVAMEYDTFHRSVTSFLGTPYLWGGNTRKGVDCSGFTKLVLEENGYPVPRVSRDQAKVGTPVNKKDFKLGDLVFFDTKGAGKITHVGLYLGGNLLAHASSKKGVTIVLFSNRYFQSRFVSGRRIVKYK